MAVAGRVIKRPPEEKKVIWRPPEEKSYIAAARRVQFIKLTKIHLLYQRSGILL